MSIFNSLGSNYGGGLWWRALTRPSTRTSTDALTQLLETRYEGAARLFYKGREAIYVGLQLAKLPEKSKVAITGYTCYAVYRAVVDAGLEPVYVDLAPDSLNFDGASLKATLTEHPDTAAVIIQNTLGYSSDIKSIVATARHHKLLIIEDLAHSIGLHYSDGREAGTVGDLVALSFSQDKVVDGVSGGALVVRKKPLQKELSTITYTPLARSQQLRDRLYPALTGLVRTLYPVGAGKVLHGVFKKLGLLSRSVDGVFGVARPLPGWYAGLVLDSFVALTTLNAHRTHIAHIYTNILPATVTIQPDAPSIHLRFPVKVADRPSLWDHLQKKGIFITDTWYDVPVAPKRYLARSSYKKGTAPRADALADAMVNLPTHRHISEKKARRIAQEVATWLSQ